MQIFLIIEQATILAGAGMLPATEQFLKLLLLKISCPYRNFSNKTTH